MPLISRKKQVYAIRQPLHARQRSRTLPLLCLALQGVRHG